MNDRIRELALEVFSFKYKSNPNELNPDHNMDHIHKFAELIVRECMDVISPYAIRMENFDGGHPITDLKKHFGINK